MTIEITIREACVEDAEAIARVHVTAWQATYRGAMSQSYLDSLSVEAWAGRVP